MSFVDSFGNAGKLIKQNGGSRAAMEGNGGPCETRGVD